MEICKSSDVIITLQILPWLHTTIFELKQLTAGWLVSAGEIETATETACWLDFYGLNYVLLFSQTITVTLNHFYGRLISINDR